jgi:hypothetical protein
MLISAGFSLECDSEFHITAEILVNPLDDAARLRNELQKCNFYPDIIHNRL